MRAAGDLERFVTAQAGSWQAAMEEIDAGTKTSHWIWFVYPQLRGLGRSRNADYYGLAGAAEARRYLAHPLLGPRLTESFEKLMRHAGKRPERIFGSLDATKLRSSATLFAAVAEDPRVFTEVLDEFYHGRRCQRTLDMLEGGD